MVGLQGGQIVGRCGGLAVGVPASLDRPSRVQITAQGLLTVWPEGRQITLYTTVQIMY